MYHGMENIAIDARKYLKKSRRSRKCFQLLHEEDIYCHQRNWMKDMTDGKVPDFLEILCRKHIVSLISGYCTKVDTVI